MKTTRIVEIYCTFTLQIQNVVDIFVGSGMYIFREYIRENVADEVSSVASRSLGDENVKMKAQQLAMALLHAILSDEQIQKQAGNSLHINI